MDACRDSAATAAACSAVVPAAVAYPAPSEPALSGHGTSFAAVHAAIWEAVPGLAALAAAVAAAVAVAAVVVAAPAAAPSDPAGGADQHSSWFCQVFFASFADRIDPVFCQKAVFQLCRSCVSQQHQWPADQEFCR